MANIDPQITESEKLNRFFTRLFQEAIKGNADEIDFTENQTELLVELKKKGSLYKSQRQRSEG
jgi:hypothetical protein